MGRHMGLTLLHPKKPEAGYANLQIEQIVRTTPFVLLREGGMGESSCAIAYMCFDRNS